MLLTQNYLLEELTAVFSSRAAFLGIGIEFASGIEIGIGIEIGVGVGVAIEIDTK